MDVFLSVFFQRTVSLLQAEKLNCGKLHGKTKIEINEVGASVTVRVIKLTKTKINTRNYTPT